MRGATLPRSNDFPTLALTPSQGPVELPDPGPAGGQVIVGYRDWIEERLAPPGKAIEVWSANGLKSFFQQEVIVRCKNFDGIISRSPCDPAHEVGVCRWAVRQACINDLSNLSANPFAEDLKTSSVQTMNLGFADHLRERAHT